MGIHNIKQVDSAVIQSARHGNPLPVQDGIALNAADSGNAGKHAGTIAVSEASFNIGKRNVLVDLITAYDMIVQLIQIVYQMIP